MMGAGAGEMLEKEIRIVAITAPSLPLWAVFTSEEDEAEIWTERVQLWVAYIRTGLPRDDKESEVFINEVPADEFKVEAMVLDDGHLVLVSESHVFLGYSPNEQAEPRSYWEEKVKFKRKLYRRRGIAQYFLRYRELMKWRGKRKRDFCSKLGDGLR